MVEFIGLLGHRGRHAAGFVVLFALAVAIPHARADAVCKERYTVSDGTVLDEDTKLLWQREVDAGTYAWADAASYCQNLNLMAQRWRLPTVLELQTLVDESTAFPAIDGDAFPATPPDSFWSSSAYVGSAGSNWSVFFGSGHVAFADAKSAFRVRCVR